MTDDEKRKGGTRKQFIKAILARSLEPEEVT